MLRDFEREIDPLFGQPPQKEISLLDLLIVVTAHRKSILAITLVSSALGLMLALVLPNRYTAETSILPPQQSSSSSGAALMAQLGSLGSLAGASGSGGLSLKNPNDLQVALLKSRTVEDAMIHRFHLDQLYHAKNETQARKLFEKRVDIDSGSKDGLIRVSVTDSDPRRAAMIANGYIDAFKNFSATLAVTEASQRRLFFEGQLKQAKDSLADAEVDLKKTEQQTGVIQLDSQSRAAISSLAQLRAQISAKEVELRALQTFATGENPDLLKAQQELAELRAQAEALGSSPNGTATGFLIPKGAMQEATLEYVRKLRDVSYYRTIYDLIARQYEAAKVDEARQGNFVQVVDRAVPPEQRSSPKLLWIVAGAILLGLIAGVAQAFIREGWGRILNNPEQHSRIETLRALISAPDHASSRATH